MASIYKNSFVYVLLGFLAPGVNFFLLPFYTRELSASEFGLITLAGIVQIALANLTGLGMNAAFTRLYYDQEKVHHNIKVLFTNAFLFQTMSGVLIHFILLFFGDQLFSIFFHNSLFTYSTYGIYIGITAITINLQALVLGWCRNREDIKNYSFWAICFFLFQAGGIFIGVVILKAGAMGNVAGRMWGSVLPLLFFTLLSFKRFRVSSNSVGIARQMIAYGVPLVPYLLIYFAYTNIDKVLLERFYELHVLGLYGFAFMIVSVVEIFINALQSATYPSLFRQLSAENRNSKAVKEIFSLFILANLSVIVLIASFGGIVIHIFINKTYYPVISYLPLLTIMAIPRVFAMIYNNILTFYKKTKVMPLASSLSFITIGALGLLLIPLYGVYGLILALILSQTVQLMTFIFLIRKYHLVVPESAQLQKETLVAALIIVSIIVATIIYNYVSENVLWYLLPFFVFVFNIVSIFWPKRRLLANFRAFVSK